MEASLVEAIVIGKLTLWRFSRAPIGTYRGLNVFKLSQNRDEQGYDNIIQNLHTQGGNARTIAEEMGKPKAGKGTIWCSRYPSPR